MTDQEQLARIEKRLANLERIAKDIQVIAQQLVNSLNGYEIVRGRWRFKAGYHPSL